MVPMTDLARQHALEVCRDLRLPVDKVLGAFDLVESARGIDWLAEQERQAEQHRLKISDAHTLVRLLATPTHEANAEICELALYLQTFAADPAMPSIVKDLRTPKYSAVLMELAFAYRWRDAGADVRLRPLTARGEADFEASLNQLPYIVECSLFPNEVFKEIRFRLPQIIAEAVDKSAFKIPVKVFVTIRTYPAGNVEAQIYEVVNQVCREFGVEALAAVNREFEFATVRVEPISPEPEYNPFLRAAEEEPWDMCIRHTQHKLRRGEPIYRALDQGPVEEMARIFVKFPATDVNAYEAIYKKLKKKAAQLSGVKALG
jgi:hypothetical protein